MRKEELSSTKSVSTVLTSFKFPRLLHADLKARANIKGASMTGVILDGIKLALASDKYRLTEDERNALPVV